MTKKESKSDDPLSKSDWHYLQFFGHKGGEHITDTYITETDTTELENLSHNIIDIFIIET